MFDGGPANAVLDPAVLDALQPNPERSSDLDGRELLEAIESEIADIAGHLNSLYGRLVHVAGEVVDRDLWHGIGYRNASHWLGMRAGLSPERARAVIAVAERRSELPVTLGALVEGRLSIDQVLPVVRRVPRWADAAVCQFAMYATVTQIRSVVTRYPFDPDPPTPAPDGSTETSGDGESHTAGDDTSTGAGHETTSGARGGDGDCRPDAEGWPESATTDGDQRCRDDEAGGSEGVGTDGDQSRRRHGPGECDEFLSLIAELDGSWSLFGRLNADRGLELDAALRAAADALRRRPAGDDESAERSEGSPGGSRDAGDAGDVDDGHRATGAVEREWSLVDAFAEVVQRSLRADGETGRRDRYRVYLHVDVDGSVSDPWHRLLPPALARQISCDADVRPVLSEGGVPIQAGRSRRRIDPDLRRMILWRDQGCCVPGCGVHHRLDVHHIRHWLDGGPTDTSNLIAVCPTHHRMIHSGELSVTGDPDHHGSLQFWNRHGRAFGVVPLRRPTSPPPEPAGNYVHPTGESYQGWSVCFGHPPRHREPSTR